MAPLTGKQPGSVLNRPCAVCGQKSAGYHFGAFTCEGCKSFFGRMYRRQERIQPCQQAGLCDVTGNKRRACQACRLMKCLQVGMSRANSRYGRRTAWFNANVANKAVELGAAHQQSEQRPAQERPAQQRPVQQRPVQERPAQQRPDQQRPDQQRPVQQRPAQQLPVQERSDQQRPAQQRPVQERPVQQRPAQQRPVQERPDQQRPVQERPVQQRPAQQRPAQQRPVQERPAQERPAQVRPAHQRPVQQRPVQERPDQQRPDQHQQLQQHDAQNLRDASVHNRPPSLQNDVRPSGQRPRAAAVDDDKGPAPVASPPRPALLQLPAPDDWALYYADQGSEEPGAPLDLRVRPLSKDEPLDLSLCWWT